MADQERMYQKEKFVEKYRGLVPVIKAKQMFDRAWYSGMRIGSIVKTADFMAETWIVAKKHYQI